MTKIRTIPFVLITMLSLASFAAKPTDRFIGTYGVSASVPTTIRLTINADHTFHYINLSDAANKIDVKGNWTNKGNSIVLNNGNSAVKFHTVWSFDNDGQVAKSRKGLCYYRLCRLGE